MAIEEKPGQPQPKAAGSSKNAIALSVPVLVIAVIVAALNLRPSIASIGPVLDQLLSDLGASSAFGGLITAIPGLAFFAIGLSAVSVGKRMGLSGALTLSATLLFVGLAVRVGEQHLAIAVVYCVIGCGHCAGKCAATCVD
ncbi:hypothetical protein [Corynebacterium sp. HMSC065H09]|uniref:hypothetical protein n=1 Tax=Corynebacterium sp. HMSC065H09 TaxID=1739382 RepID=UPI000AF1E4AD|nr:hypothetical protein [Corynebacterium sp. HMSC065H09]